MELRGSTVSTVSLEIVLLSLVSGKQTVFVACHLTPKLFLYCCSKMKFKILVFYNHDFFLQLQPSERQHVTVLAQIIQILKLVPLAALIFTVGLLLRLLAAGLNEAELAKQNKNSSVLQIQPFLLGFQFVSQHPPSSIL